MTTYLTIITTVLVITQIIRVLQNALQLRRYGETVFKNDYIMQMYEKIVRYIDDQPINHKTCENCKFILSDMDEQPCVDCSNHLGDTLNWEVKA